MNMNVCMIAGWGGSSFGRIKIRRHGDGLVVNQAQQKFESSVPGEGPSVL